MFEHTVDAYVQTFAFGGFRTWEEVQEVSTECVDICASGVVL